MLINLPISKPEFLRTAIHNEKFFNKAKTRIIVENNTYGGEFFKHIKLLKLTEGNKYSYYDNIIMAKFFRDSKDGYEYGIRRNRKNK